LPPAARASRAGINQPDWFSDNFSRAKIDYSAVSAGRAAAAAASNGAAHRVSWKSCLAISASFPAHIHGTALKIDNPSCAKVNQAAIIEMTSVIAPVTSPAAKEA
jgi:hypothetical protein